MANVHVVRLVDLPPDISVDFIKDCTISLKSKQQGFKYFSEGYFHSVKLFRRSSEMGDVHSFEISAKCHRSMRKNERPHAVNIDISTGQVNMGHCSCTAGSSGSCSHLVGLLIALQNWLLMGFTDIPDELACTSLPQQWNVPRGNKIEPEAVPQITIIKPHPNRKRKPVENTVNDCRNARVTREDTDHLKSLTGLPISYLVSHPKKVVEAPFGKVGIGSGLSTHGSFYALQKSQIVATDCGNLTFPQTTCVYLPPEYHPLPQNIVINIDSAKKIEEDTRLQANCEKWFSERRKRITASKFAEVRKRKVFTPKYIDSLINSKPFTSLATNHGKSFECRARQEYVKTSGNHVHDCGLVVNPEFPFIGATPDGKVCDNGTCGILEVKCPYTARDMSLSDATKLPNFCSKQSEDGHGLTLKNSHDYYCQVQGQLLVTGSPFCDFIVYTKKGFTLREFIHVRNLWKNFFQHYQKCIFNICIPCLIKHKFII